MGAAFYGFLILVAIATIGMHPAREEVLPLYAGEAGRGMQSSGELLTGKMKHVRSWLHLRRHRPQFLAWIITNKSEPVAGVFWQSSAGM